MGSFTSVVSLVTTMSRDTTLIYVNNWKTVGGDKRRIGEGVMIGNEICMLTGFSETQLTIARGCADTIPQPHASGTPIWFYEDAIGLETAPNERAAGTSVGVKILTTSVGGGQLALTNSPPNALTFNQRFERPYPPGQMKINGVPWYESTGWLSSDVGPIVLSWAHRDRKLQGNILVWHGENSIGPEPGTTYTARVYDLTTLVNTYSGITGTTFTYTYAMALADFGPDFFNIVTIKLCSVRDGLESWQEYSVDFAVSTGDAVAGWGYNWGNNWGGNP